MKSLRIIYHLARADFYERVRRYSFLVMLGLVVFLGYQVAIGNITLELGKYRGEFNSAWVGAMISLIATFFIGWFGFYMVKGSVTRDRETGVGQIMATTPLTRPLYLVGKWLSNFAVLMAMVLVLALAGIVIQFLQGENMQVNLAAYLAPFVLIVMPLMLLVAATAVLFECIPFLQGGFGNIVYFFAFIITLPFFMDNETLKQYPAYEPMGLGVLSSEMGKSVRAIHPDYDGSFTLGGGMTDVTPTPFTWDGIQWTSELIFARFSLVVFSVTLIFLAALFFDRFDPSRSKPRRMKSNASTTTLEVDSAPRKLSTPHLTPLRAAANRFNFPRVLLAELKLMLKGQRWWWVLIALGIIIAGFNNDLKTTREIFLPLAWIWHVLLLSALGNRESHHNVQQMTFSSASPLWRQLPAQWLAGFIVTLVIGSGAALNFIINGDTSAMFSFIAGAIFIPSLALALGVWSGTSKVFEVVYVTLWYIGPLNRVPPVDFTNASGAANPMFFILSALALIAFAVIGRARQLRN